MNTEEALVKSMPFVLKDQNSNNKFQVVPVQTREYG